jgi:protein-disulfide isomerase-like protein with CxxC motif
MLGFTYCQVPIIYQLSTSNSVEIQLSNGSLKKFDSLHIDKETSKSIFERDHQILSVTVSIKKNTDV